VSANDTRRVRPPRQSSVQRIIASNAAAVVNIYVFQQNSVLSVNNALKARRPQGEPRESGLCRAEQGGHPSANLARLRPSLGGVAHFHQADDVAYGSGDSIATDVNHQLILRRPRKEWGHGRGSVPHEGPSRRHDSNRRCNPPIRHASSRLPRVLTLGPTNAANLDATVDRICNDWPG